MNKVTAEMKSDIMMLRARGLTFAAIGERLGISSNTVAYHADKKHKEKTIARAIRNQKPRNRTDYNRKYHAERYKNDPEFRERVKKDNRENQRKKYKEKNGTK